MWLIFKCMPILIYCYPIHCCFYSLLFIIAAAICRLCLWRCESDNSGPSFSCCAPHLKYISLQQQQNFPQKWKFLYPQYQVEDAVELPNQKGKGKFWEGKWKQGRENTIAFSFSELVPSAVLSPASSVWTFWGLISISMDILLFSSFLAVYSDTWISNFRHSIFTRVGIGGWHS